MTLKIRYFAWVREQTGRPEEELTLPDGITNVRELMSWLSARGPEYEAAFAEPEIIRVAIDQVHVTPDTRLTDAKEVAFFPPVTGG